MPISSSKILITGAGGMLGRDLAVLFKNRGEFPVETNWPHLDGLIPLDITDEKKVGDTFAEYQPEVVFNCAAYTNVDGAEKDEELATRVNGKGPGLLAEACKKTGIRLVHVSTDYVFDGQGSRPYLPDDPTGPRSAYGRSKLAGEEAIRQAGGDWLIVRTSWLFGQFGKNFVDTILSLARVKPTLRVVNDQVGCPTYTVDLARCLVDLAGKGQQGMVHFCNPPPCSWFDLARAAVTLAGLPCKVEPCTTAEFPRPAKRPAYSVLDCTATFEALGWQPQSWEAAVRQHLHSQISNIK